MHTMYLLLLGRRSTEVRRYGNTEVWNAEFFEKTWAKKIHFYFSI